MKNIEDKLDGFEQVLGILVKKISMMESLLADPKVPVDDLARQMLAEIQASLAKVPPGSMMISELTGIRKRIDALSLAQKSPKPVTLNFLSKSYLALLAIFLSTTIVSLGALRFSNHKREQDRRTVERYEAAQRLSPRLTRLIDNAFNQTAQPSIDSLKCVWELLNVGSLQTDKNRRKSNEL